jgi:hypothetical protein
VGQISIINLTSGTNLTVGPVSNKSAENKKDIGQTASAQKQKKQKMSGLAHIAHQN